MVIRFLLCAAVAAGLLTGDTLRLKDGRSLTGNWLGADGQKVRFVVNDQVQTFQKSEVAQVIFGDGGGGAAAPDTPVRVPAQRPVAAGGMQQVQNGIRIEVTKCERQATESLTCSFVLEALRGDVTVASVLNSSYGRTYLVDSNGIEQTAQEMKIGASRNTQAVQQVPVKANIQFGGLEPSVTNIAMLAITIIVERDYMKFVFRHVPVR